MTTTKTTIAGEHDMEAATIKPSLSTSSRSSWILFGLFATWFGLDAIYNISNKESLRMADLQWTMTETHFVVGALYYIISWVTGLKPVPSLSVTEIISLLPLATYTLITHLSAVMAVYLGSVSFMHIVKAGEPLASAVLAIFLLRERYPVPVYLSLIPIVAGIATASYHEHGFSVGALAFALVSLAASALRGIQSKRLMATGIGRNMTASNLYGVLTIMSMVMLLVPCLIMEAPLFAYAEQIQAMRAKGLSVTMFVVWIIVASVTYTWFNEVSFLALHRISPITYAVANTSKRTVIVVTSVFWFRNHMTGLGWLGGAISMIGVLLYGLAKAKFKQIKF